MTLVEYVGKLNVMMSLVNGKMCGSRKKFSEKMFRGTKISLKKICSPGTNFPRTGKKSSEETNRKKFIAVKPGGTTIFNITLAVYIRTYLRFVTEVPLVHCKNRASEYTICAMHGSRITYSILYGLIEISDFNRDFSDGLPRFTDPLSDWCNQGRKIWSKMLW